MGWAMSSRGDGATMVSLILLLILLGSAAIVPALVVWTTVPPVSTAGELDIYLRLGASIVTAIAGAFVGGYVLQTAVETARSLGGQDE